MTTRSFCKELIRRLTLPLLVVLVFPNLGAVETTVLGPIGSARRLSNCMLATLDSGHTEVTFCSISDLGHWYRISAPPNESFVDVVAATPKELLVLTVDNRLEYDPSQPIKEFKSIDLEGKFTTLATKLASNCDFFDHRVGCQIIDRSFSVTTDGGNHWRPTPIKFTEAEPAHYIVTSLIWPTKDEVVVAQDNGTVDALHVTDNDVTLLWHVKFPSTLGNLASNGGNLIFAETGDAIVALDNKDGHEVSKTSFPLQQPGLYYSVGSDRALAWGHGIDPKSDAVKSGPVEGNIKYWLLQWNRDGATLKFDKAIETDPILLATEIADKTLIVFASGKVATLDHDKFLPQDLTLKWLGPLPAWRIAATQPVVLHVDHSGAPNPILATIPTREEQLDFVTWQRKTSAKDLDRISREVRATPGLNWRQRVLLTIQKCKEADGAK